MIIKTKVWDNELKEWVSDTHAVLADGSVMFDVAEREWQTPADPERFTIVLYTGLKDKDGVKIFEGDIIRYVSKPTIVTRTRPVVWKDGAWTIEEEVDCDCDLAGICSDEDHEGSDVGFVIGNIYENPELLNMPA